MESINLPGAVRDSQFISQLAARLATALNLSTTQLDGNHSTELQAYLARFYSDKCFELFQLQQEHKILQNELSECRRELKGKARDIDASPAPSDASTVLDAADQILQKAREDYEKLQNDFHMQEESVGRLRQDNSRLSENNTRLQEDLKTTVAKILTLESDLRSAERAGKEVLVKFNTLAVKYAALEGELLELQRNSHISPNPNPSESAEVHRLQVALAKSQEENKFLQGTIHSLRDMVHKALPQSSARALHRTSGSLGSIVPTAKSATQATRSVTDTATATNAKPLVSGPPCCTSERKSVAEHASTKSRSEVIEVDDDEPSITHTAPTYVTPIPERRLRQIASVPSVVPDISDGDSGNRLFTRAYMGSVIGGNIQPLIVSVQNKKPLSEEFNISKYLAPNLDQNPWCPSRPGEHGFIFVGLGGEWNTFTPEEHGIALFVGIKENGNQRLFRFMGFYSAVRVDPLTIEEWQSLSEEVRHNYCKTTKKKTKDVRPVDQIALDYAEGRLSVPCVRLKCTGFSEEFHNRLVSQNIATVTHHSSLSTSAKRRREEVGEEEGGRPSATRRLGVRRSI